MRNIFRSIGFYLGLVAGMIFGYFSLAIVFHLAESGNFIFLAIFIPFFVVVLFSFLGYIAELLIRKFLRKII